MNRKGVIVGPKTPRANRSIHLDHTTVARLQEWKIEPVGTSISGGNIGRTLDRLSTELGFDPPIIPYDLRHTAITLQSKASLGYSDWELAEWAGTSESMINQVYRHRTDRVVGVKPVNLGADR